MKNIELAAYLSNIVKEMMAGGPGSGRHKSEKPFIFKHSKGEITDRMQDVVGSRTPKQVSIDPKKLIPTQDVNVAKVVDIAEHGTKEDEDSEKGIADKPRVVAQGGKYFIYDGHHRVAASLLDKQKQIKVYMFKAEEQPMKDQKKEWPLQGKTTYQGLKICIENKKGSIRSGKDPHGKSWSIKMPFDYGYVSSTKGVDGDEVDCFLGPNPRASHVFIVHQRQNKSGSPIYDEDKCFLGWDSADAAKKAYHSAFNNVDLFHSLTMMSIKEFKQKLNSFSGKKLHASLHAGGPGSGRHKETYHGTTPELARQILKEGFKTSKSKYGPVIFTHAKRNMALSYANEKATNTLRTSDFGRAALIVLKKGTPEKYGASVIGDHITYMQNVPASAIARVEIYKMSDVAKYVDEDNTPDKAKPVKTIEAGGPGSGPHEWFTSPKPHAVRPAKEKNVPTDEELVKSGMQKHWDKQTDEERHAIARHESRQEKLFAGGPGSGRHPWGRKAKPSKQVKQLKDRVKTFQQHRTGNAEYLKKRYDEQQQQNKEQGKNARGKEILSTRQHIAVKNAVLIKKEQHDLAEKGELLVVKALSKLGGVQSRDNSPMDVTFHMPNGKLVGLEVKSMMLQKQDRIYSKGAALQRKNDWGKTNKANIGIVALDFRNNLDKPDVYYRKGIGSFAVSTMTPVEGGLKGLASAIGGK